MTLYELTCWYGREFGAGFRTVTRGTREDLEAIAQREVEIGGCVDYSICPCPPAPRFSLRQRLMGPIPRWSYDAQGQEYRPWRPVKEYVEALLLLVGVGAGLTVALAGWGCLSEGIAAGLRWLTGNPNYQAEGCGGLTFFAVLLGVFGASWMYHKVRGIPMPQDGGPHADW